MARNETSEENERRMITPAFLAALIGIGIIVIGGAVYLGKSDSGAINVADTINQSNETNENGQVNSVSQTFQDMPNGGLVAQEEQGAQPVTEEVPQENASSTLEMSSTTEPVVTTDEAQDSDAAAQESAQNEAQ